MDENKTLVAMVTAIILIGVLIFTVFIFDASVTIDKNITFKLVDKYHEESCTPIFGGDGTYYGENCGDEWTIIGLLNGQRLEKKVSGDVFKSFVVGDCINMSYQEGRLGGIYQLRYVKADSMS